MTPMTSFDGYKPWMHSTAFKGPVFVLPVARQSSVVQVVPDSVIAPEMRDAQQAGAYRKLAAILRQVQYGLHNGAAALEDLPAGRPEFHYVLPPATRLSADSARQGMTVDAGSDIFAHLPDTSWNLLATRHRV